MKNAEITQTTYAELKSNPTAWIFACNQLSKTIEKKGNNTYTFLTDHKDTPAAVAYDMMMNRTGGKFSPVEWYNVIATA